MHSSVRACTTTFGLALALGLSTAVHAAAGGAVTVRYEHPENFTETKEIRAFDHSQDQSYLGALKRYIEKRGTRVLADGQRLDITITDVDRAGSYLPTATSPHPVRIVKDIYPPRIDLHFRLLDAQGRVIREGDRSLTDINFMHDMLGTANNADPIRYEENLIDRWMRKGPDQL